MENNKENNPLLCDVKSGMCEIPTSENALSSEKVSINEKPIKIIYYTDPICSSCWGLEPQLRKLKLEYGHLIDIDYRMGGLLPDWAYMTGGLSKPADVAEHWDEVSLYYDMPIDGDLWLEDPMSSSYPPSIAFKAAQMQDSEKAVLFLRQMRELLFLEKKNMAKWENIVLAAKDTGLDMIQLLSDYEGRASDLFKEDLLLAKKMSVKGFPTFFFANVKGDQEIIYGTRPYEVFESKILKLYPKAGKRKYNTGMSFLFQKFKSLTVREFTELSSVHREKAEIYLENLSESKTLEKTITKNGNLYFKE